MDTSRPNVLLLIADEISPSALRCFGGPVAAPNLERLAQGAAVVEGATCAIPSCVPSRKTLATGVYPHVHGIFNAEGNLPVFTDADQTTEKALHASGYHTRYFGGGNFSNKLRYYSSFAEDNPDYRGLMRQTFDQVRQLPREKWMDCWMGALPVEISPAVRQAVGKLGERWRDKAYAELIVKMGRLQLPLEKHHDVLLVDRVVAALKARASLSDPFMLTCSIISPHDPYALPSPYYEMYPPESISLPANWQICERRFQGDWAREIVADLGEAAAREALRIYYGSIRLMDDQVGRVLDALQASGKADDTIVVFTADHGDMAGGHGMFSKITSAFYDENLRVPLMLRYPRRIKPGRYDLAASLADVKPTLLELLDKPIDAEVQGRSLAPYLCGARAVTEAPPYCFAESSDWKPVQRDGRQVWIADVPQSFMVRGQGWKYMRYRDGEEFLFDLRHDPGETRNLANDPPAVAHKRELSQALKEWLVRTRHPLFR